MAAARFPDDAPAQEDASLALLLRDAREGDPDALGRLIQRYRNYLLLIANQDTDERLRAKLGASDIVQESMLKAQDHFNQFNGNSDGELKAWLKTILTNDIRKNRRRFDAQKRNSKLEINIQEQSAVARALPDLQLTPASDAIQQERMRALRQAMQQLAEDHRQVVHMRNIEGQTFQEIGIAMNRSPDAARKLWARALEALRVSLQSVSPELVREQDSL